MIVVAEIATRKEDVVTNSKMLMLKIEESHVNIKGICQELGLTYKGFQNKRDGIFEFKQSEIAKLMKLLRLTREEVDAIFFN